MPPPWRTSRTIGPHYVLRNPAIMAISGPVTVARFEFSCLAAQSLMPRDASLGAKPHPLDANALPSP